jgi:alpha-tubulin suppressor-like RCC1 family protein
VSGALTFAALDLGGAFSCGITTDSLAYCWGWNTFGQLGDGSTADRPTPVAVAGGHKLVGVAAGVRHACALGADSTVYCWGANDRGQLGNGLGADTTRPVAVSGGLKYATVAAGFDHTCALTGEGAAYCWGDNTLGQLGDTALPSSAVPHPVESDGRRFTAIATGGTHTCAIVQPGAAYCWGNGSAGQLGAAPQAECTTASGPILCNPLPIAVQGSLIFAALTAGNHHSCGLTVDDVAYCWGLNDRGQLGDGTRTTRISPVRVATQQGVP